MDPRSVFITLSARHKNFLTFPVEDWSQWNEEGSTLGNDRDVRNRTLVAMRIHNMVTCENSTFCLVCYFLVCKMYLQV